MPVWLGIAALALFALALVVVVLRYTAGAQPREVWQQPGPAAVHVPFDSSIHYQYEPPSSGPHYPSPKAWGVYGVYDDPVPPGYWVHNLEHGGIAVLYDPARATPKLRQQLAAFYIQLPPEPLFAEQKMLITPYAHLDHLLRLQAWGWTLPLDHYDANAIAAFYTRHVDKGPEQVP